MISALNTVQDLATTSPTTDGDVAVTSGFKTIGDGGGGNFLWKTVATYGPRPTSDGGIVIYALVTTGWWERQFPFIDLRFWGAKGDVIVLNDGAMTATSNVLTSPSAAFTSSDIGKTIYIVGAGASGLTLTSSITGYTSASQVSLANNASTTITNSSVTYGTDSTNAFKKMNLYLRAQPSKSGKIEFQSGTYMTAYNNWLAGINEVEVIGNGANIMCTRGAAIPADFTFNLQGLFMPSVFDTCDNNPYAGSATPFVFGHKIASTVSTAAGSPNSVTITDSLSGTVYDTEFKPGSWVLIYGFDHENIPGFPPDPRYYDYAKVVAADSTTGLITLDRPLNYEYDAQWPDSLPSGGFGGAPRIISCNRPNFNAVEDLTVRDLFFVPFTGWVNASATPLRNARLSIYGYINARFINIRSTGLYPSQGKNLTFEDCQILQPFEPDKVIDQLRFINCSFNAGITNGGGTNFMLFYGCTFSGQCNVNPRYLDLDNCTFASTSFGSSQGLFFVGFNKGVEHLRLGTNVWNCNLPSPRTALLANSNSNLLKIDGVISNTEITVTNANWILRLNGRQVLPGSIGYTSTNKKFTVTRVYADPTDPGNVHVVGNFSGVPVAGEDYYFIYLRRLTVDGRQHKVGAYADNYQLLLDENRFTSVQYQDNQTGSDIKRTLLTEIDVRQGTALNLRSVFGYGIRLVVNVIKPYTGTDATAVLKLLSYSTGSFTQTIDLKTAGTRIAEIGRNAGSAGTDILVNLDTAYFRTLQFYWQGISAGTLTGDATVLPIFQVYLEAFELPR